MLTLHYLPVRARGEPLRMLLRHAGIPYADKIYSFAEWPKAKRTMPKNDEGKRQVPVLDLPDGTQVPETAAIAKYIAERAEPSLVSDRATETFGLLYDKSQPWCCDALPDLGAIDPLLNFQPQAKAEPKITALLAAVPPVLSSFADRLGGRPYFGGDAPDYGDFGLFHFMDNMCTLDGGESLVWMGASGIGLQAWYDGMRSLPAVATYLSERPQPATGEVGAKGSIIAEHREPWRRHDK